MSEEVWCRLCLNICNDYQNLYDETGQCNNAELYDVTVKYFHPTILSAWDENTSQTVMCSKCWRHISEFHSFQNDILLAQEQLSTTGKPVEVYVKEEHPPLDITDVHTDAVDTKSSNAIDVKNVNEFLPLTDLELMATNHSTSAMANSNIEHLLPNPEVKVQYEIHEIDICSVADNFPNEEAEQDTEQFLIEDDDRIGIFTGESIDLCLTDSDSNAVDIRSDDESTGSAADAQSSDNTPLSSRHLSDVNIQKELSAPNDVQIAKWLPTLNCPLCDVAYLNFGLLCQHFKVYHSSERPYAQCCGRRFFNRHPLAEHACLHLDPNRFKCKVCGLSYSGNSSLKKHMLIHPKPNLPRSDKDKKNVQIGTVVGESIDLSNAAQLSSEDNGLSVSNAMMRRDYAIPKAQLATRVAPDKEPPINVDIANDACIAKWLPTLNCPLCDVECLQFSLLFKHFVDYHPDERAYAKCCEKRFYCRSQLAKHIRLHLNPKRMNCASCGICYSSEYVFREHMIKLHPKSKIALNYVPKSDEKTDSILSKWKPNLECALCKKSYCNLTLLSKHFKLQHPHEVFHILCCKRKLTLLRDIRSHALCHTAKEK